MMMNTSPQGTRSNMIAETWDSIKRAWQFLIKAHPLVREVGERQRAQLLSGLSLITAVFLFWGLVATRASTSFVILLAITVLSYSFSRTKYFNIAAYLFSFGFTSLAYINIYDGSANSIDSSINSIVPMALILASAILSQGGYLALLIAVAAATISIDSYADPKYLSDPNLIMGRTIGVTISTAAILFGITAFRSSVEQARLKDVEKINTELEDLTTNLEQRVNDRTAELEKVNQQTSRRLGQLQAITELSEAIAQVQDLNELFPATTRLINERFGFYHVGIFLTDNEREFSILQAANSEGGKRMLIRGHRLRLGTGVVGFAAQSGQARIALNVGADTVYFNNPDLPDTRSEVAIPLKSRTETIGVLDVQSTEEGAFTNEDLQVLTTLANQVSIAIENARLLTETRAALAQVQEVYDEFTRAEWSRTVAQAEQPGFRYQTGRIEMIEKPLQTPEVVSAVQKGEAITGDATDKNWPTIAVPVRLRGEVIGVLHIESNDPAKLWSEGDISLVEAVAERAAIAMENARLFQDARRRAAKESMISEASARISSALNIENILRTTAEELGRVLGGSEVMIQFKSEEKA